MAARFGNLLRGHAHFFCLITPLILLMTYPTIVHVFDTSSFWLPTVGGDVWITFWDAWHFKLAPAGKSDFYHTNLLFYPEGISLVTQPYSLPHMLVLNGLQLIMPAANAACLTILLNIFGCALAGYIYCLYLFKDKWLSLLGAVVFGLSQPVLGKALEPSSVIFTLPLTLYFLHRALDDGRLKFFAIAGALLGFTAYISMYIFVFLGLTVALFLLFFARSKWRDKRFWASLLFMGMLALAVSSARVLPMVFDSADLGRAIKDKSSQESGSDLMGTVYNFRHPALTPLLSGFAGDDIEPPSPHRRINIVGEDLRVYIGFTTLALIGFGLLRKSSRKPMLPWLLIAAAFMILRLGPELKINGVVYEDILLPKHYLNQLLPTVFAAFYRPDHFHIGALMPLAILACYGLRAVLAAFAPKKRVPMILAVLALIAFETYILPYSQEVQPAKLEYAEWLAAQDTRGSKALIELPMTGIDFPAVAERMQRQTIHGYPTLGGYLSRVSPSAYDYINANPLLSAWRRGQGVVCSQTRRGEISAALEQLHADGFSHVALHKGQPGTAAFLASFAEIAPVFANAYTFIYELSQLRENCDNPPPGRDSLALYLELVSGDVIQPRDEAVVTFHPSERVHDDALRYLSWHADLGQNLSHATLDAAGEPSLQSTNPQMESLDDIAADHAVILLLGHPDAGADEGSAPWDEWLSRHYQLCQRSAESEHIAVDYYLRRDMPCELVTAASPLELIYDNGSRLRNLVVQVDGGDLRIALWWQVADGAKTSYSIQVFDEAGARVRQIDHVMNLSHLSHTIDLSDLSAGEYHARLIVYDFESGTSHGGEIAAEARRFGREIEIARFGLGA